jgi:hypothetical protein
VLLGRFSPRATLPGLSLCGASVIGAGIAPCTHSGYVAGKLALRYVHQLAARRMRSRRSSRIG